MPLDYGEKLTQLFITSGWPMHRRLINEAYEEFVEAGWEECRDSRARFRCLSKFDADIETVRGAAKKNPGMIFVCFTVSGESDETVVHMGIGGAWLKTTRELSEAIGLRHGLFNFDYVRTIPPRRSLLPSAKTRRRFRSRKRTTRRRSSSRPRSTTTKAAVPRRSPKTTVAKGVEVTNRLVFHGLPTEVEQCRTLALDMLPAEVQTHAKYTTTGGEHYLSGTMEFPTQGEPALRVFNRLVARIPAVTVSLEYADVKSGQRRELRAVDGKIKGHRTV
jgi:hypothetical protein